MSQRAPRAWLWSCLAAGLASCSLFSRTSANLVARPGPYDRLASVSEAELEEVQAMRAAGELESARALLAEFGAREPRHLPLARMLQDVEIELWGEAAHERLLGQARAAALERHDVPSLLLAARLERDAAEARRWLEEALELEPESAWVHYALAHDDARAGRWSQAGQRLARALLIDPGHLWVRRLESMLLARAGRRDDAIPALQRWLRVAERSPLLSQRELDDARLDLAQLLLLEGDPASARTQLDLVASQVEQGGGEARLYELTAAVEQAQGRPRLALAAAWQAEEAAQGEPLPLVQQALLHQEWLSDIDAARAAWQRVLELARGRNDLSALLLTLRARAALARLGVEEGAVRP